MITVAGTVESWNDDEGWGVLASVATPGGCWAHFSALATGSLALAPDQAVRFTVEEAAQDGFRFRAVEVLPADGVPDRSHQVVVDGSSSAYGSTLELTFDEPDSPRED